MGKLLRGSMGQGGSVAVDRMTAAVAGGSDAMVSDVGVGPRPQTEISGLWGSLNSLLPTFSTKMGSRQTDECVCDFMKFVCPRWIIIRMSYVRR